MEVEKSATRVAEVDEEITAARQNEAAGYLILDDITIRERPNRTDEIQFTLATPHGNWTVERCFSLPKDGAYSSAPELAEFLNHFGYTTDESLLSIVGEKVDAYYDNTDEEWVIGRNPRREYERDESELPFGKGDRMAIYAFLTIPSLAFILLPTLVGLAIGFTILIPVVLWCDQFNDR